MLFALQNRVYDAKFPNHSSPAYSVKCLRTANFLFMENDANRVYDELVMKDAWKVSAAVQIMLNQSLA